ncbi:beta-galactosidase [Mucilaginibacter sp. RS28]|uniref:Beta-galactosidase n=1 Tax=Mucilaginibacter straminoryzae TaxID=2932774 RepID=A0A9X1X2E2_9SPHI|nr:beta-galactosidase family protein [Mucilaginibacter straminoryzae]MCJ8209753.1 beta-galactosidase [Mucilaginibacter straminoryzae]
MKKLYKTCLSLALLSVLNLVSPECFAQSKSTSFSFRGTDFMLNGNTFQIISGEMHPARIPREYWRHRIQMAKAMGCNTIAVYIFWNYLEEKPGQFDLTTDNRDVAAFIKLCQQEGMWVILRPGPYVCGEWDFGGLPPYLLSIPDIKVRCSDERYMAAVKKYVQHIAPVIAPLQCDHGGPILMVQVENEYGSYGNDKTYMNNLKQLWVENGITVPFYTADGPAPALLEAGTVDGAAIGLDSGSSEADFQQGAKMNPNVPVFSSETYPGWLTHWGEKWAKPDTAGLLKELRFLMKTGRSFNLYVVHGGTNFGFTAGANAFNPTQYQPDVTSYDYDAPISEQGFATPKYYAIRKLISQSLNKKLPAVPKPIATMAIPEVQMTAFSDVWNNLPASVKSPQPLTMEAMNQYQGLILYKTKLVGHKSGKLLITEPHDFAYVFLNGKYIDKIERNGGKWFVELPKTDVADPELEIMVEAMGHINFAEYMIDRKGITDRVSLNGMTLMNWEIYNLPFDEFYIRSVKSTANTSQKPMMFFKGGFNLKNTADTYIDLSNYTKGIVWINRHNLGRYWHIGPQDKLYCPASWLKKGNNEVLVFDLLQTEAKPVKGDQQP